MFHYKFLNIHRKIILTKLTHEPPCESDHFLLLNTFSLKPVFHFLILRNLPFNYFLFNKSRIFWLVSTYTLSPLHSTPIRGKVVAWTWLVSNWLQLTLRFPALKHLHSMVISFLLSEIFEGCVEDFFGHLKGERSEIITKPSLSIEHLEIAKILKHFEWLLDSKILHMPRHVLKMIKTRLKFRIFPSIPISRSSRSTWSHLLSISISIIGRPFLRIW